MVVCLYNSAPQDHLTEPLGSRTTMRRLADYVRGLSSLPCGAPGRVLLYSSEQIDEMPEGWELRRGPQLTESGLTRLLAELTRDAETELLFAFLDQPYLNLELTGRMLSRHRDYRAEYTFADGYPTGLAPEIVCGSAVAHLDSLASGTDRVTHAGLFPIVQKDINRLDVETVLSVVDQRLLRLQLSVDTRPNLVLCRRLSDDAPASIDAWPDHVVSDRAAHRTLPRFVSVQIVEQEVQKLAYSPYPSMRDDVLAPGRIMSSERFSELVDRLDAFSPEAIVQLSLWGEAALHPEIDTLVERVLATDRLGLLIETSGTGWSEAAAASLFARTGARLTVIVGLDTNDRQTYESLRGPGFDEAQRFAARAVESLPEQVYVQAVRSALTEPTLDAFYREWKERTSRIIVEKYDHFAGRLPDLKIGDISPLRRFPCWHLQRDLYVLVDGTVPLCREDVEARHSLGNVFSHELAAVWESGRERYVGHIDGAYGAMCEACDEYYTFTF